MSIVVNGGATQTPANSTLSQLQTRVLRYIGAPDHSEAQAMAISEINAAIGELNQRNWNWALTYTDLTMVVSTADYNLPANWGSARMAHWLNSSSVPVGKVSYLDPKSFDEAIQYGGAGTPIAYTVYNFIDTAQLSLDVPMSAAALASYPKLRHRYFARVPTLVNASDTLPVPSEVEEYIVWAARLACCLSTDPDGNRMAKADVKASRAWQALVSKDCNNAFKDWE
jgi:hypothetical protein